jgi:hypothetical protein
MKIQKFNEKFLIEVETYLEDFNNSVGYSILDWIETVSSNTKLKEYKNVNWDNLNSIKKIPKLIEDKNFKYYNKFLNILNSIKELENKITLLDKQKEKLEEEVTNEVMYKFQEELLEKDIDGFYKLFLEHLIEESTKNNYEFEIFDDIHPSIYKKYKNVINKISQVEELKIKRNLIKYNV